MRKVDPEYEEERERVFRKLLELSNPKPRRLNREGVEGILAGKSKEIRGDLDSIFKSVVESSIEFEILRVKEAYRELFGKFLEGSGRKVILDFHC